MFTQPNHASRTYCAHKIIACMALFLLGTNILLVAYGYARFATNATAHMVLALLLLVLMAFACWRAYLNRQIYKACQHQTPVIKHWLWGENCAWLVVCLLLLLMSSAQISRLFGEGLPLMD